MIDNLYDFVEQHTEIIGGALVWTWAEHCKLCEQITDDIFYENICVYSTFDDGYSFFGNREELLKFAEVYTIWDKSDLIDKMKIDKGVLVAEHEDDSCLLEYSNNIVNVDAYGGEIVFRSRSGGKK